MIERVIRWSVANRLFVLLGAAFLAVAGIYAATRTPVDALPDLSDTQVIIRTSYPGQAPNIVEAQVTYPLASTMLSAPQVAIWSPSGLKATPATRPSWPASEPTRRSPAPS